MRIEGWNPGLFGGIVLSLALLLGWTVSPLSIGEENAGVGAKATDSKASPSAEPKDNAKKGEAPVRRKKFRPSERITADSAVAFPVDI